MTNLTVPDSVKKAVLLASVLALFSISFISCSSPGTVDGQAVLEDPCQNAGATKNAEEAAYVDVTIRGNVTTGGTTQEFVEEYRVNGSDWHKNVYDGGGDQIAEVYYVNHTSYAREIDDEGQWSEWDVQEPPRVLLEYLKEREAAGSGTGPTGQDDDAAGESSTFCGLWDLSDVRYLGEVTLATATGDLHVEHFAILIVDDIDGGGFEKAEYWIDADGTILQIKDESFDPYPPHRVEATTTYHGFGEPNTITAPDIP